MNKAIFILGMHRSGTSALARVLNLLGVELGSRMMAAASDNERGFWEHEGAVQIHEDLLCQLGHKWCDGTPLPEGWLETEAARNAQAQLATLIDLDFLTAPLWGIKDPRLSLLFPLWLPLLKERGIEPLCVVAWRNPLEVAGSLMKRDHLPQETALLCWLAYTLESLHHAQDFSRVIVSYDDLLKDWRSTATRIASELNLICIEQNDAAIEDFLSPELRHHRDSGFRIQDSAIGQRVKECVELLAAPEALKIEKAHTQWQEMTAPFAPLLRDARRAAEDLAEPLRKAQQAAADEKHRANDVAQQMSQLYDQYTATLEREKEAQVQTQMLRSGLRHAEEIIHEMQESTSWKITEPLRKVKKMIGENEEGL
jgi:hypothetical protein